MLNRILIGAALLGLAALQSTACAATILFVGNSFTFGGESPAVQSYRPETVTDLNNEGMGGVPALFRSFTREAGLAYDVYLETAPGVNLDFHYEQKAAVIARAWDHVVVQGYSTLDARELLTALQAIEGAAGRERPYPGAARTLDLDLILFGDRVIDHPDLCVPHPRFRERRFVLEPLAEIAPNLKDPESGRTVTELLAGLGR